MQNGTIFPLFYLPPVAFFSAMLHHRENVIIEKHENFPKQTYRNRASIHSANGKLDLIIPVVKGANMHSPIKDVRISYEFNWQRIHLMSLQSSYRKSAYFEFYEDMIMPYYEKKWTFLFDYNLEFFELISSLLKLKIPYSLSDSYLDGSEYEVDFRQSIHPKKETNQNCEAYFQVFEERNGFLPNLSIADLLFNQGPQSAKFLI